MKILVVGASGATGKLLVYQLLEMGQKVKIIVRPSSNIPDTWNNHDKISISKINISDITIEEMADHVKDCQGIASCLGHTLNFSGIYGHPRKLVADTVAMVCDAIKKHRPEKHFRFVLMNTAGNSNRDLNEPLSTARKLLMAILRKLLPPQRDNEAAADYLRLNIGRNNKYIQWVTVRPDSLIDHVTVTEYELHASPIRSALFDPGKTSRINVGNFMARLLTEDDLWNQWKGQMPVIYNN